MSDLLQWRHVELLRSRDRREQDCVVSDLCGQVRAAETERDALRAEVERLIGELRLQDQANDILTTEIERLRKGSDAKSALVPVAEIRPQDHPCGGPPIMRAYGHALSWTVDSLDHRLGRGNGAMLRD